MQLMLLRLEQQEMQLMLLVQAVEKQLEAPKLADHLASMAAEEVNKAAATSDHIVIEAVEYTLPTPICCIKHSLNSLSWLVFNFYLSDKRSIQCVVLSLYRLTLHPK